MTDSVQSEQDINPLDICGFDDFPLLLGDIMRGERATLGKSLEQAAAEIKIREPLLQAIESCDTTAFASPSFISGNVRSYATYLGLDPEACFDKFCQESGFVGVHAGLEGKKKKKPATPSTDKTTGIYLHPTDDIEPPIAKQKGANAPAKGANSKADDAMNGIMSSATATPDTATTTVHTIPTNVPPARSISQQTLVFQSKSVDNGRLAVFNNQISPSGVASIFVLLTLIIALGYGGWVVLQEVQRVQFTPPEENPTENPTALAQRQDTINSAAPTAGPIHAPDTSLSSLITPQDLDRIYRPKALEIPKLVARDGPISLINPNNNGIFATERQALTTFETPPQPQVIIPPPPLLDVVALYPAWIRVTQATGEVLFERLLKAGERYRVPIDAVAPTLHAGNAGAVYLMLGDQVFGPIGKQGVVVNKVSLTTASVPEVYQPTTSVAITNLVENNLLPPVNQTKDESTFVDNILE